MRVLVSDALTLEVLAYAFALATAQRLAAMRGVLCWPGDTLALAQENRHRGGSVFAFLFSTLVLGAAGFAPATPAA